MKHIEQDLKNLKRKDDFTLELVWIGMVFGFALFCLIGCSHKVDRVRYLERTSGVLQTKQDRIKQYREMFPER